MRVLTEADAIPLGKLCEQCDVADEASKSIRETGLTVEGPAGLPVLTPMLKLRDSANAQIVTLAREFGLSPSSRSRIRIDQKQKSSDPLDEAIFG